MTSLDSRRDRLTHLSHLYDLRRKIDAEIARIASEIDDEIRAMQRAKNAARLSKIATRRRPIAECGTDGGYYRHRRTLGEEACDACKLAHRVYEANRRQRSAA